jgi:hypothetical protein
MRRAKRSPFIALITLPLAVFAADDTLEST